MIDVFERETRRIMDNNMISSASVVDARLFYTEPDFIEHHIRQLGRSLGDYIARQRVGQAGDSMVHVEERVIPSAHGREITATAIVLSPRAFRDMVGRLRSAAREAASAGQASSYAAGVAAERARIEKKVGRLLSEP